MQSERRVNTRRSGVVNRSRRDKTAGTGRRRGAAGTHLYLVARTFSRMAEERQSSQHAASGRMCVGSNELGSRQSRA
jgi:hypothetical protein